MNTNPMTTGAHQEPGGGDGGSIRPDYRATFGIPVLGVSNGPKHEPGAMGASGLQSSPLPLAPTNHKGQPVLGSNPDST